MEPLLAYPFRGTVNVEVYYIIIVNIVDFDSIIALLILESSSETCPGEAD